MDSLVPNLIRYPLQSNQACNPIPLKKRSTEEVAGTPVPACTPLSADGPWVKTLECTNSVGDPNTAIPSEFQSLKVSTAEGCDFTTYEVTGSKLIVKDN